MDNCEIVENTACGKPFQYCRTHKVEAQDCPGKVQTPTAEGSYSEFEITTRYQAPTPPPQPYAVDNSDVALTCAQLSAQGSRSVSIPGYFGSKTGVTYCSVLNCDCLLPKTPVLY